MKLALILFGILNVLLGALPMVKNAGYLPAGLGIIPTEGLWYSVVIGVIGLVAIYMGFKFGSQEK